jgi:hypothetical protein
VRNLWSYPFADWCYLASCGASSGMLIMWDKRIVEKIDVFVGEFVLACSFRSVEDDFSWAFAGFYGPNMDALRSSLWMSWLASLLGGCCLCVLGETLTSFVFLPKDRVMFA